MPIVRQTGIGFYPATKAKLDTVYQQVPTLTAVTASVTLPAVRTNTIILANATSGAITVTLPANSVQALTTVKKTDSSANVVTVAAASGEYIDGVSTVVLTRQYQSVTVQGGS
jgi:hypothetical protein